MSNIAHIVPIDLGDRSYEIAIGTDMLDDLKQAIQNLGKVSKIFVLTDDHVAATKFFQDLLAMCNGLGIPTFDLHVRAGEASKSFAALERLAGEALEQAPDRNSLFIALGGGVVGDLTGFLASMLLRGVRFIQVPTSLLAMVDSSVGGKTGINTDQGKNLIGAFYQPKRVVIDVGVLGSLPDREWKAGYAEVVKYALIHKPEFLDWLIENEDKIKAHDAEAITHCIKESCESKADIVAQDEKEGGVRALLNLGHTFGHALEAEYAYDGTLIHGEAVSIGMMMALRFSAMMGQISDGDITKVENHFKAIGLPTTLEDKDIQIDAETMLKHMQHDKKVSDGKIVLILVKGIGKSYIDNTVAEEVLLSFLQQETGK